MQGAGRRRSGTHSYFARVDSRRECYSDNGGTTRHADKRRQALDRCSCAHDESREKARRLDRHVRLDERTGIAKSVAYLCCLLLLEAADTE